MRSSARTAFMALLALLAGAPLARAQEHKLQKAEIELTKTADPARFSLHGYAVIDDRAVTFDTVGRVASHVLTFTITYKAKSIVGALGGGPAQDVTVQVTRDLGALPPEGKWVLRPDDSWDALIYKRSVPAPGTDPTVALAMTLPLQRSDEVAALEKTRFGVTPKRWLGYLDDAHGEDIAKAVTKAAALSNGKVPAVWLYTVAIGEGLNLWIQDGAKGEVSGFLNLGVDTFGARVAALKQKGYLPASFTEGVDYTLTHDVNEHGEDVTSADFPTLEAGLTALQAMLQESRDRAIANMKQIYGPGLKPTADDIRFWEYLDFNVGQGRARKFMQDHPIEWGRHRDGPEPSHNVEGRYNALLRVATARHLSDLGAFVH